MYQMATALNQVTNMMRFYQDCVQKDYVVHLKDKRLTMTRIYRSSNNEKYTFVQNNPAY